MLIENIADTDCALLWVIVLADRIVMETQLWGVNVAQYGAKITVNSERGMT